jgi:hypothetical protein
MIPEDLIDDLQAVKEFIELKQQVDALIRKSIF